MLRGSVTYVKGQPTLVEDEVDIGLYRTVQRSNISYYNTTMLRGSVTYVKGHNTSVEDEVDIGLYCTVQRSNPGVAL